jgi:hypothetical protein
LLEVVVSLEVAVKLDEADEPELADAHQTMPPMTATQIIPEIM